MPEPLLSPGRRKSLVIKRLERAVPTIRTMFGVRKIGIFGSFARGEHTRRSDLDILIEFEPGYETYKNFIKLADYLEETVGRKVDLLTESSLSPLLRSYIEPEVIWCEK